MYHLVSEVKHKPATSIKLTSTGMRLLPKERSVR